MDKRRPIINVMIKPLHDCNMNCDYCFVSKLKKEFREQRMSLDLLDKTYEVLSNSARKVSIIWHGGEPTLMGVEWYKNAIELSYKYSDKSDFEFSMQSNGLLLDENWIELMEGYGIHINSSYDGMFQKIRQEKSSEILESNLMKIKELTGQATCLSIITPDTYKGMLENYKYFREKGIQVGFNYGINGDFDKIGEYIDIPIEDYMKEYLKYFKYWVNDREGYEETSCITPVNQIFGLGSRCCNTSDCRKHWVNINPDGSVTHCNRQFPKEYTINYIRDFKDVESIYETPQYQNFCQEIQFRIENTCTECEIFEYCKGGCQSTHLMNSGKLRTVDEGYCERFKLTLANVYRIVRNIDIYKNDNLNLSFLNAVINQGKFMPKEIKEFMLTKGINLNEFSSETDSILNSTEFELFRIFNPSRQTHGGHSDCFIPTPLSVNDMANMTKSGEFRNERFKILNEVFNSNIDDIIKMFRTEV